MKNDFLTPVRGCISAAIIASALLAAPSIAAAQSAPTSPAPAAPSPQQSPIANPSSNNPQQPAQTPSYNFGILGDFDGQRQKLQDEGITFFGRYDGEFAAVTSGGRTQGTAYSSEFQLGADIDFKKLNGGVGNAGILHFIGTERFGSSVTSNNIGNIASVQEIYGDGLTPRLTELDYEQPLDQNRVNLRFGRVIMQNDFAASSSYWGGNLWCTFQSNAICGTPVAAPNNSGYGYYPSSEWGARIRLQTLSKNVYVQTGVYQVNPIYGERYQGFNFSDGGDTGVMIPLETGYQFQNAHGDELGNIKVGAYYDTSDVRTAQADVSTFLPATNDVSAVLPTNTYRGREGGWFLVDHLLEGSSLPNHTGTAIFFSYEYGDPQTALISNFVDGGIVRHGTFAGRSLDTIAVGFDYIDVNPRIRDEETLLQQAGYAVPITNQEKSFELNYGFQVTQAVTLHPNIQYVVNPAGEANVIYTNGFAGIKNAVVLGIDTNITF